MKHLFIVNPKAGKGKALKLIPEIEKILKELKEEYIIEVTKAPNHATELVKMYTSNSNYRVYSVGGDGTLNEVLNGMVNSKSCLGVIPAGSGNDFIKSAYEEVIDKKDLKNIIIGRKERIDLAKINNKYFINISSAGMDAEVVSGARKLKKFPFITGGFAYVLSVLITICNFKSRQVVLEIDDVRLHEKITLIAFANGKYYGGGMKVAPFADLKDGNLDICIVNKLSRIKMFRFFPSLIKGEHDKIKEVSFKRCKRLKLKAKDKISINIDGEVFETNNVEVELIPKGIEVIIPQ